MKGKDKRKCRGIIIGIIIVLLAVAGIAGALGWKYAEENKIREEDLHRIAQAEYDSIFLSMYSIEGFQEEDFITYRGVSPVFADYKINSLALVQEYLDRAFGSANLVTNVYLGLDPWVIREQYKDAQQWQQELQERLTDFFVANEGVDFEILLPYPEISYWLDKSPEQWDRIWASYQELLQELEQYPNVAAYFMGAEKWLIANPGNYTPEGYTNEVISRKMMLYTFCDRKFRITADDSAGYFERLTETIGEQTSLYGKYPDFSDKQLIFFGDSIIGNYEGSYSIPGVISGLADADTYNYAIGGSRMSVSGDKDRNNSFSEVVELFLAGEATEKDHKTFVPEEDKDLCFLILYGFNDYFEGARIENEEQPDDTETFKGGLRTGMERLRAQYPEASIVLLTPTICKAFSYGQDRLSAWDDNLEDYIIALEEVAAEQDILLVNGYRDMGLTEENIADYLLDDCHLNEEGRFKYAEYIISCLEQ